MDNGIDTPDAPFYKLKAFCLYYAPDDRFITAKDLAGRKYSRRREQG